MPNHPVTLVHREEIARATWAISLASDDPFAYHAGQRIELIHTDPPFADANGNQRTFSLATAPGTDHLVIVTRRRDSGFKRNLLSAPLGTRLEVEGPRGSLTLPETPTRAVLIAGGIGVTPFRAMIEDSIRRLIPHSILLLHFNRIPEETPFLLELERWSVSHPRVVYRPSMTRMEASRIPWRGDRSRISPFYLAEALPEDRDAWLHLVAGPERFVRAALEALRSVGAGDRVRTETFTGY